MYGIFTHIYHILSIKTTIHVGKYASRMVWVMTGIRGPPCICIHKSYMTKSPGSEMSCRQETMFMTEELSSNHILVPASFQSQMSC